ncbi:HPr family phosphocarrier protein [Salicibibacter kimchii]|uniref:HPr family phosphocarrier protein n=1 Tax=Salicibibacter kimchii TaxID=2099786 RepID=A0A345BZ84_9BACI|nr:HPr family phosphocarrier protein [Salicibibacter kimchii]AXF56265.1 HPr family phosphocarrier protein [Salicibibacter kimchii]
MVDRDVEVKVKMGLQARPAALFVQEANRFHADINVIKGTYEANAKSIMGVMSLAVPNGATIRITADGGDEEEAVKALAQFVSEE